MITTPCLTCALRRTDVPRNDATLFSVNRRTGSSALSRNGRAVVRPHTFAHPAVLHDDREIRRSEDPLTVASTTHRPSWPRSRRARFAGLERVEQEVAVQRGVFDERVFRPYPRARVTS